MNTNLDQSATNIKIRRVELYYPELSYKIVGILYATHNQLGGWGKEKHYSDEIERRLKEIGLSYRRECIIGTSGCITDFIVEDKIILEVKAKRLILKEDFSQVQRYLQETGLRLGILVNFRNKYLKPLRVVRIDHALSHSLPIRQDSLH